MDDLQQCVRQHETDWSIPLGELRPADVPLGLQGCSEAWALAFAPDSSYLAWSQGRGLIRLLPWSSCLIGLQSSAVNSSAETCDPSLPEHTLQCASVVWCLAFGLGCAAGSRVAQTPLLLAAGLADWSVIVWDACTGTVKFTLLGHTDVVRGLTFSQRRELHLVSCSRDHTLRVWDNKGKLVKVLHGHKHWVYACAFSPDSTVLCSVGSGREVCLWDTEDYELKQRLEGHRDNVVSCSFSPNGDLLATASYDSHVLVWDTHKGVVLQEFRHVRLSHTLLTAGADSCWLRCVTFCKDGLHLASLADDWTVRVWKLSESSPQMVAPVTKGLCCAFSPDGNVLAVSSNDGSMRFWMAPCQRGVVSLLHLCWRVLCEATPTQRLKTLGVPPRLVHLLSEQTPQQWGEPPCTVNTHG